MQLQLRIPCPMNLQDLMSDLALSALESIKRELDSLEVPFESYTNLENRIISAFSPFLKARSACGMHPVCTEQVEGPSTPEKSDHIFLIELQNEFGDMLDRLVQTTTESMRLSMDAQTAAALNRRVRSGLRENLAKYIYCNPVCGTHDICEMSYPVNPWSTIAAH
jgi:hypothetical protein